MANAPPSPPPAGEIINEHSVEISQNSNKIATINNSIDDIVERYMVSSTTSLLFPFFASLAWIFDCQQTFINVFSDSQPSWHCTSTACNVTTTLSTPCNLPSSSWSFSHPRHISTISDFSLECSSPVLLALPSSSFYAGCLVGGLLLATLADSFLGRKYTLFLSCLIMSLTAALTALSPNLAVYSVLRFCSGFARANVGTTAYVLSSEQVPRRQRNNVSIITFLLCTTGFLTLPIISFLNRENSWRLLYLYTSIPSLLYSIFLFFFMKESPRWLFVKGRREEAIETLKKLSCSKKIECFSNSAVMCSVKTESGNLYSAMRMLREKRWALRRLLAIVMAGFGIGIMYHGMPLNLGNFNASLYIAVALNAAVELLSALVVFFLAEVMSRRRFMVGLMVVSGGCSLACTAMGGWLAVVVELLAFFGVFTAFAVLMIYMVELFPTCVRTSALAVVRQAVVEAGGGTRRGCGTGNSGGGEDEKVSFV
ncbi:organic cation/carnitine transporter 2-like [Phalaenopsis equestris]|uniref:organic cation/carnitine transporter 2-like n=1 Tax=Phalaenopsis equestris TaxID=78828 RepID=UPI0009E5F7BC|nr:organic cation/carnitine transporter 2-like [Phalaenopsis equestris]